MSIKYTNTENQNQQVDANFINFDDVELIFVGRKWSDGLAIEIANSGGQNVIFNNELWVANLH